MSGTSTKTVVVGIRLPMEVAEKAKKNAEHQERTLSQYLARILTTQIVRKR